MKEDQNIDELFRSSFEEFGVTPPPAVKEAIDRGIAASSSGKRGLFWFLLVFAGLGLAAFLLWPASETAPAKRSLAQQTTASEASGSTSASAPATSGSSSGTPAHTTTGTAADTAPQKEPSAASAQTGTSATAVIPRSGSAKASTRSSGSPAKVGKETTGVAGAKQKQSASAQKNITSKTKKKTASKRAKNQGAKSPGTGAKGASGSGGSSVNDGNATNGGTGSTNGGVLPPGGALASGGTTPPNTATGENPVVPPADSTQAQTPPAKSDSTETAAATETPTTSPTNAKKPPSNTEWWRVSLYGGPQLAFNQPHTTSDMKLTERPAFQFSAEVNRSLWNGYGFSTGIQYANRSETLNKTTTTGDSTQTWVVTPIYDQQVPDSIIGYDSVVQNQYTTSQTTHQQVNHIQSFGIPLYVTKHFEFGDTWGVLVNLGTVFQFYKVTLGATDNIPAPVVHDFSVNVVGRVHATYRFNGGWMISAGLNGGLDLKPAAIYTGMDRKRYYLTPQIGLHYSF